MSISKDEYWDILQEMDYSFDDKLFKFILSYRDIFKKRKIPKYSLEKNEQLFKDFYDEYKRKIYKDRKNINEVIGTHGEMLFYQKLLENVDGNVTWVSRYYGDRFGFDIVSYDEVLDEYTFYEVKTTVSPKNLGEFFLTDNEYKQYIKISDINEKVKFVLVNILVDDERIIDQVDYYFNPDKMELSEHGKFVVKEQEGNTKSENEDVLTRRLINNLKK